MICILIIFLDCPSSNNISSASSINNDENQPKKKVKANKKINKNSMILLTDEESSSDDTVSMKDFCEELFNKEVESMDAEGNSTGDIGQINSIGKDKYLRVSK